MTDKPADKKPLPDDKKKAGTGKTMDILKRSFTRVSNIARDTAKDLKEDPKEVGVLLTAIVVPAGLIGYGAYRAKKYHDKKGANDNKKQLSPKDAPPKPKKPKQP